MRPLYSLLFYCLMPLIMLRMLWRSRLAPEYRRRWGERLGFFAAPAARPVIWVHAVSVGETLAAVPVIEALLQRYPQHRVVVTTTTPTGSERVRALFGERVFHVYAPWDLPGAVRRFVRALQPELLLVMETELWPNMLHFASRQGCRILLANARLSARSAAGYARVGGLTRQMLGQLDCVACQATEDGERFVDLGLARERLEVTGSIKFDLQLGEPLRDQAQTLRQQLACDQRPVLVAASTHPGEDEQILTAFGAVKREFPQALLILVPRHPERFDRVAMQCHDGGWQVHRRTAGPELASGTDVLLGDTMGELLLLLGAAQVAIVGGSLVEHGGHNVLEAAAWGAPVVTGPWMFNFEEISQLLVDAGAMVRLADPAQLGDTLLQLLGDAGRRQQMGEAGLRVVAENGGARECLLALVAELLPPRP
ncbi:3-deoxy-D-manno-octulosonic acid transferase [Parahaliea maris]|uniref:3-deoxy-D-manno-octulosonic acid transferase n=1 Tax=Parahaliea maris TaxID=2716870 RepID=A0A5C9A2H9_9GAMM|nr:lipid IV(A) 3-deoxy-D-manno-octulosonic acid transferase [Parahaliea maris]TXS93817.1 3-deoxy-D-manno-octulosonic acid transferase [Parahaliea maris]